MIKIEQQNETLPLRFNKKLSEIVDINGLIIYTYKNYPTFSQVNEIIEKFQPKTYVSILLINNKAYEDLIIDRNHLRSFINNPEKENELFVHTIYGKTFIIPNDKVEGIMEVQGLELLENKIKIDLDDITIIKNKDLSKVTLNFARCAKIGKND